MQSSYVSVVFRLFILVMFHSIMRCKAAVFRSTRLYDYISAAVLDKHTVAEIPLAERLQWIFASADLRLPADINEQHETNVTHFYDRYSLLSFEQIANAKPSGSNVTLS